MSVLQDLLARGIDGVAGLIGAHGLEAGLVASALILLWHGHSILSFLHRALRTVRIAFIGAALVAVLLVVAFSMGWLSFGSLPSIGELLAALHLRGVV